MKTLTKILFVSLMSLFLTSSIFAQSTANASATVKISLLKGLTMTLVGATDVDFGTVVYSAAETRTVTPAAGAKFEVLGHPGRDVDVTFNASLDIDNGGGETMTFTPNVEETQENAAYGGAVTVTSGDAVTCVNVAGTGTLYLWLGGDLDISLGQVLGDYTGSFQINVAY